MSEPGCSRKEPFAQVATTAKTKNAPSRTNTIQEIPREMITIILCAGAFLIISWTSIIHALGSLLAVMILHGALVLSLGETATHLPLYAGATTLVGILTTQSWRKPNGSTLGLFLALIPIMGLAALAGLDQENSAVWLLQYTKVFMLSLLIAGCVKSEQEIKVLSLYCLAAVVIGAYITVYQHVTGTYTINTIYEQRASGLRGDPNDTAMLLITGIPLALYWITHTSNILLKLFFLSAIPVLLTSIMLTGSRGGFVTLVLIAIAIYLKRPTLRMATISVIMAAILAVAAPQAYWDRVDTLVTGKEKHGGSSLGNRTQLLLTGLDIFIHSPVLGVGTGNFGLAFATHGRTNSGIGISPAHARGPAEEFGVAHNLHLEFFVEHGMLAGLLFWLILYQALINLVKYDGVRTNRESHFGLGFCLALALGGMLFAGLFLSQGKNPVLWFLVGVGFAAGQIVARESNHLSYDYST